MQHLQPFNFDNQQVRVIQSNDGEPMFVAKDVAEALGYVWKGRSGTLGHVPDEWKGVCLVQTPSGRQQMAALSEQGLYFFVARSDKPKALPFQRWLAGEVLPAIRKTGQYAVPGADQAVAELPNFSDPIAAAEAWIEAKKAERLAIATKAEIGSRREATAMNTASIATKRASKLERELDRAKEYCTIKRMSMLTHGQSYNWRLLKSTSQEMGIPPIDVFDANYGTVKAYHADVWLEAYGLEVAA